MPPPSRWFLHRSLAELDGGRRTASHGTVLTRQAAGAHRLQSVQPFENRLQHSVYVVDLAVGPYVDFIVQLSALIGMCGLPTVANQHKDGNEECFRCQDEAEQAEGVFVKPADSRGDLIWSPGHVPRPVYKAHPDTGPASSNCSIRSHASAIRPVARSASASRRCP